MADPGGKGLLISFGQKYFGGLGASPQVIGDATALKRYAKTLKHLRLLSSVEPYRTNLTTQTYSTGPIRLFRHLHLIP